MSKIEAPTVLSFERKLNPSDALFFAGNWEDRDNAEQWVPVTVRETTVRGTSSNRLSGTTIDVDPKSPNPQRVEVATLPNNRDTLKVRFTLRVLSGVGLPSACNNPAYQTRLAETVEFYVATHGFKELAKRYACNLANGRFLWRNGMGVESIEVRINYRPERANPQTWCFNARDWSLRNFDVNPAAKSELDSLSQVIETGLQGKAYVLLDIAAYVRLGEGQEVFPSQELILDKSSNQKGQKSKTLYQVADTAAMHSQKIGNALRTIDTWYPKEEVLGPIAVEPYGSVTSQGKVYRHPEDKIDFYSLFDNWVLDEKAPEAGNQHFVIATLIRGGVFSSTKTEDNKNKNKNKNKKASEE